MTWGQATSLPRKVLHTKRLRRGLKRLVKLQGLQLLVKTAHITPLTCGWIIMSQIIGHKLALEKYCDLIVRSSSKISVRTVTKSKIGYTR